MEKVAKEHDKKLAPLTDDLILLESGLDSLAFACPARERPRRQSPGPHRQRTAPADEGLEDQTNARAYLEGVVSGGAERGEDGEGAARARGH